MVEHQYLLMEVILKFLTDGHAPHLSQCTSHFKKNTDLIDYLVEECQKCRFPLSNFVLYVCMSLLFQVNTILMTSLVLPCM